MPAAIFFLKGLAEGVYDVTYLPDSGYLDTTVVDIPVTAGIITKMDTVRIDSM